MELSNEDSAPDLWLIRAPGKRSDSCDRMDITSDEAAIEPSHLTRSASPPRTPARPRDKPREAM